MPCHDFGRCNCLRDCTETQKEKLSFDLWFNMRWHGGTAPVSKQVAREIWNKAQENK